MKDVVVEFEILNWEKYNPRTDAKHCTWFRFDASIFDNPDVMRMNPSGFKLYMYLLSKALRMRGAGRELLTRLTRECMIRSRALTEQYLSELQAAGIIKFEIRLLSKSRPLRNETNETNVTERIKVNPAGIDPPYPAEKSKPKSKAELPKLAVPKTEPPTPRELAALWNAGTTPPLRQVDLQNFSRDQRRWVWAVERLRSKPDLEYWREVIARINSTPFCRGENDRGWTADFEFLVRTDTHAKVMEGKYNSEKQTPNSQREFSPELMAKLKALEAGTKI